MIAAIAIEVCIPGGPDRGEVALVDRGTLPFALCHGFRHVDGVPYDDGMGHQIEAPGLLDQFVATCAPQVSPFCLKFFRYC